MTSWKKGRRKAMSKMEREQTTIRLEPELMDKLRHEADEKGYTVRDLIVFILWDYFRSSKFLK